MKKTAILLLVSILTLQLNAQDATTATASSVPNTPGKFYFIPKAGYNLANISKLAGDARSGINAGISGEYIITPQVGIEAGAYYSMQGTEYKISSVKLQLHNDYINVPILLKGYIVDGLNIFAGPQVGFLVNSRAKINSGISLVDNLLSFDIKEYVKSVDFSIAVGLGYQFDMGLMIAANYNIGISKVPDLPTIKVNDDLELDFNPKARNNVLQISVGYKF